MENWHGPLTLTDNRCFFGLAGYYRRCVDGFSSIASPFTTFTQKSMKLYRSEACERNVQILKDRFISPPMLILPEGTNDFMVYCDGSRVGFMCVLMQHGKVLA